LVSSVNGELPLIHEVTTYTAGIASLCAAATSWTIVGGVTCGTVALGAAGAAATTGLVLYAEGKQSGLTTGEDLAGLGLAGIGSAAKAGAESATTLERLSQLISSARAAQAGSAVSRWDLSSAIWLSVSAAHWDAIAAEWAATARSLENIERRSDLAGAALAAWQSYEASCDV
jgi:hypothetical protein